MSLVYLAKREAAIEPNPDHTKLQLVPQIAMNVAKKAKASQDW